MAGELFKYLAIDKWGEPRMYYLLTHQHGDHLRKVEALPSDVTLIISKDRDEQYGLCQGDALAEYYEYLSSSAVSFEKLLVRKREALKAGSLSIRVVRTDLHSDFFLITYAEKRALVCGDFNANQVKSFVEEAVKRDVDEVYIPVYAPHAEHLTDPSERGVGRVVYRLGWLFKSRRYFTKLPRVIALGHSEGAKKPPWADEFIPPIKAEHTLASPR